MTYDIGKWLFGFGLLLMLIASLLFLFSVIGLWATTAVWMMGLLIAMFVFLAMMREASDDGMG